MVKKIRRKSRLSYNQPKIFSPEKEKGTGPTINFHPLIKIILVLLIICAVTYFVFFSSLFSIKDILVEGNQLIQKDKIVNSVPVGGNIFLISNDEIKEKLLAEVPEIRDAQIYKGIPNAIKVVILEHNQSIIWKSGEKFYLVSSEGYAYRNVTDSLSNYQALPRVEDNSNLAIDHKTKVASSSFVSFVQNIQDNFFNAVNIEPDYFYITESTFDLYLKTRAGFVVKFDTLRSSKKQLDDLKKVLTEKRDQVSEYVDLRIDGWAYYK